MNWPLLVFAIALAQDGPIPPQRVDPQSIPVPESTLPVRPTEGPSTQEEPRPQSPRTDLRENLPRVSTHRVRPAASIFTDEEYRVARVRSLLVWAMEERK